MRVLIVDDHRLFLDGITSLIGRWKAGIEIHEAGRLADARNNLARLGTIDLILLDLTLPDSLDPLRTAVDILAEARGAPVVAVSMLDDPVLVAQIAQAGVRGYVRKSDRAAVMLATFEIVLAGGSCIPSSAAHAAVPLGDRKPSLSARQMEVLRLIAEGLSNKEIARRLAIADVARQSG